MRALVTGGAGFIGSNLVDRLLAEEWQVDVVDDLSTGDLANLTAARASGDRQFSFHRMDVATATVVDLIARRQPNVVFHLAAQADVRVSVARPAFDAHINVIGSLNVLEGAVAAGVDKVVFASSGGTIYGTPEELPVRENHSQHPESPYGVAKKAVGDYLYAYRATKNLEYTSLALANVYGPRQDPNGEAGVVAIWSRLLLAGEQAVVYGDGSATRDYVYVDDVVDAFVRAASRGGGLTFNIGTGIETSTQQLYDTMAAVVGRSGPPDYKPARLGELQRSSLDPGRAEIHLGWKPWTGLSDGLSATLDHFRH